MNTERWPNVLVFTLVMQFVVDIAIILDIPIVRQVVGFLYLTKKYVDKWFHFKASVTIKDNKLIMIPHRLGGEIELFPTSETTFYGNLENIGNIEVSFSKNDNGSVGDMTMRIGFTHMLFDKIK